MDLFDYPPELNKQAWEKYIEYRKINKFRKLKPYSEQEQMKWLIAQGGNDIQQQIIDNTTRNGWQGLFELKGQNNAANQTNSGSRSKRVSDKVREIGQRDIEKNGFTPTLG